MPCFTSAPVTVDVDLTTAVAPALASLPGGHPAQETAMTTMTRSATTGPILQVPPLPWLRLAEVSVAPLARGDVGTLRRVFDGLSPGSRYLRFLTPVPRLSPAAAGWLAEVDHDRHGCWVARVGGEAAGIGRYIRTSDDPAVAEIALEVVDAYQGRGLGRLLGEVVGAAAADVGITSLRWLVDVTNRRARKLAGRFSGRFTPEHGVLEGTTPLPQLTDLDITHVVRRARAARRCAVQPADPAYAGREQCGEFRVAGSAIPERDLSAATRRRTFDRQPWK